MLLVRRTAAGDILWWDVFEVSCLESYALERNELLRKSGVTSHEFVAVPPNRVEYRGRGGRLIETYCRCTEDGQLLANGPDPLRN